jgi:transposase-like protein
VTESKSLTVAKRPMINVPAEERARIALEALQAYQDGQEIADIAPSYGVSDVTLYALLLRDHEPAWKVAQESRAVVKRDSALNDLSTLRTKLWEAEQAHDALSLAQIREQVRLAEIQAKRAEWELERVMRRIYGQDVVSDQAGRVSITLNISAPQQQEKIVSDQ